MLINLYNGKPTSEYQDHYAIIAQIIENKIRFQQKKDKEVTPQVLYGIIEEKITDIVGTVKDKLHEDAKKDGLIVEEDSGKNRTRSDKIQVKDYRSNQTKFDEILSAVGDYFELFKTNTNKLEDLWLQLLDYLKLKNHSQFTLFKRTHYSIYIRKVIKQTFKVKIIEEASKWVGTDKAGDNLEAFLEKIKEIERDSQFIPDSYQSFQRMKHLKVDLNAYTAQKIQAD